MIKKELQIHESLFDDIISGKKTRTIRLGDIKVEKNFKFISTCTKKIANVKLISTNITKYKPEMNLKCYYNDITEDSTVTIIDFVLI